MGLNDAVLMTSNGSWDHPPESLVWNREHAERRDVIIEAGTSGARTSWGFKDPRTLLTLQFWQEAPAAFSFVGSFRHPLLVARSLEARNGMDVTAALSLWKHYNDLLLRLQRVHGFPIVSFDASAEEYAETLRQVRDYLHLQAAQSDGVEFLDDQLRHRDLPSTELPRDVALVYDQLLDVYRHPPGHPR